MAKGFEVPRRTIRLVFEVDEDMAGAEVVCRSVSLREFLSYSDIAGLETFDDLRETFRRFGDDVISSWNLTQDGEELEATGDGLLRLDTHIARLIYRAWLQGMSGVSGPLEPPSPNGGSSLAASMPMVTL